jgi:hypothetical protein
MSDISRMDLFRAAGQIVQQGMGIWGLSQEQRRASQFQSALTAAREEYRQTLTKIEQTPFEFREDGTNVYEEIFEGEILKIRDRITQQFLGDPMVKNQFDLQWEGITQSARQAAMDYAWRTEKVATTVRGYKNLDDTFHLNFADSQGQARQIIEGLFQAGIVDAAGKEEMWSYWRQQGGVTLQNRVTNAVAAMDREAVERLFQAALDNTIIRDPEVAAGAKAGALHQITINEYTGMANNILRTLGEEAAIEWVYDPRSMPDATDKEWDEIRTGVQRRAEYQRSETIRQRNEIDRQFSEAANELEVKMTAGDASWAQGLEWLQQQEVSSGLHRENWEHLQDRWTKFQDIEANGQGPIADNSRNALWSDLMEEIKNGADHQIILDKALRAVRDDIFNPSDFENIRKYSEVRDWAAGPIAGQIEAIVRDAARERRATITDADVEQMRGQIYQNMNAVRFAPDGTPYSPDEITRNMRTMALNLVNPQQMRAVKLEEVVIESLLPEGGLFGNLGRAALLATRSTEENALQDLQDRKAFGIIDVPRMQSAIRVATIEGAPLSEDSLRSLFLNGRSEVVDPLTEAEKRILDTNVRTARLAQGHIAAYRTQFGEGPAADSLVMLPEGIVAFERDGRIIRLGMTADVNDERWMVYRQGMWVASDELNARRTPATPTPRPTPGSPVTPEGPSGADIQSVDDRAAALRAAEAVVAPPARPAAPTGPVTPESAPRGITIGETKVLPDKAAFGRTYVPLLEALREDASGVDVWTIESYLAIFNDPDQVITLQTIADFDELLAKYGVSPRGNR